MFSRIYTTANHILCHFNKFRCTKPMDSVIKRLETRVKVIERQISQLTNEVTDIKIILDQNKRQISSTSKRKSPDEVDQTADTKDEAKKAKADFITNNEGYVEVYTDGACENNGKSGAKAGLGVWFGHNHPLNIAEPVRRRATNNVGEIEACTRAVQIAHDAGVKKLSINTDSEFLINCITKWLPGWKRKNWVNSKGHAVINKDELKELDETLKLMDCVKWNHVRGHRGNTGNEEADKLAKLGATKYVIQKK